MTDENELYLGVDVADEPGFKWTLRKRKFCYHYARNGGNAQKACKDAGFKDLAYGTTLLKSPTIVKTIQNEALSCLQKLDENSETIIARWSNWLRGNVYDHFKMDQEGNLQHKDPELLTEAQKARVKKLTVTNNQYGQNVTIELHDQAKAQDRLAEILGLINSQHISSTPQETAHAIRDLIGQMSATRFEGAPDDVTLQ